MEILSGTDWKQDETTRKPIENKIIPELAEKKEEAEETARILSADIETLSSSSDDDLVNKYN